MNNRLYRIIDANFNRSREALRGMEEYCRFLLDDKALSGQAKQMRHRLCEAVGRLDAARLLTARNTDGDVGRGLSVEGQLSRANLADCFTASAKRASEGLRVLAEMTQTINGDVATVCEQLRFEVYGLEKAVFTATFKQDRLERIRLYVLVNVEPDTTDAAALELARRCIAGGADALQLRAKGVSDRRFMTLAGDFVQICKTGGAVSIINDRTDIAVLSDADGVHLGQDELHPKLARTLQKKPMLTGGSTHSLDELHTAMEDGFDYVGVGPAFASPSKPNLKTAGLDYVRQAVKELKGSGIVPVAIGGIGPENLKQVLETGVKAVAVASAVIAEPEKMCRQIKEMLTNE
ncbi:MAG: thiamine phosphate synthase [Phycisphaerae bacterium]|nr:thiamine phosphate synthase [Phycisphaerae bacterium]